MFRRSILQIASRSSLCRVPLRTTTQIPSYLSSRRVYSVSQKNGPFRPDPDSSEPEIKSRLPTILTGGVALGSAFLAAYYYGFLDRYLGKEEKIISEYTNAVGDMNIHMTREQQNAYHQADDISEMTSSNSLNHSDVSNSDADFAKKDVETHQEPEDSIRSDEDKNFQENDTVTLAPENVDHDEQRDVANTPQSSVSTENVISAEESYIKPDLEQKKAIEVASNSTSVDKTPAEIESKSVPMEQTTSPDMQEVIQSDGTEKSTSLLDDYHLQGNSEEPATSPSTLLKDISSTTEDVNDGYITKDGKLVLDFLQAIHAAEERQAKLDARSFAEEKRAMKEKYEKELKDAGVRELMYAEREAILDKELNKERVKAAAALKSLQENLEEKLKTELEQKEMEIEQKLKQLRDIAKAELAAAIASEKASQIEKMAEANLHINALCMAFYARSEEARQSHSIHKLALGALALEDALSKGQPIAKEIEALHNHLQDTDKDSLIPLVLSSLPEDTQKYGTDTPSQLNHKFDSLKGTLRHFSLIPPGGGGVLSHSLAHIASWLKVKEADQSGDGIESLINRVDSLLAQGKLCEAADTLEKDVRDSQAAEVVDDWVRRARNRAITEQALKVLQSYATSVSLT